MIKNDVISYKFTPWKVAVSKALSTNETYENEYKK
jgi:hypothetical protein